MKHNQRLDYARLAEVLHERGMADLESLREMLQQSLNGGTPFPEALVQANLVSDWELSRVVCEIFNLPFVPVDMLEPRPDVARGLDRDFLVQNGLVPIGKFGQVLTIAMPGLVPADILGLLAAESELVILPVVGTVETNRRWLAEHLPGGVVDVITEEIDPAEVEEALTAIQVADATDPDEWGEMFDDADASVLEAMDEVDESGVELEFTDVGEIDSLINLPSDALPDEKPRTSKSMASGRIDLPPMPDFE